MTFCPCDVHQLVAVTDGAAEKAGVDANGGALVAASKATEDRRPVMAASVYEPAAKRITSEGIVNTSSVAG